MYHARSVTAAVVSSPLAAFSYIAVFGVGSMMGMAIMSLLLSVPAHLTVEHFARSHLALRGLSGLFSVGLGLLIVYENGVANRLFFRPNCCACAFISAAQAETDPA